METWIITHPIETIGLTVLIVGTVLIIGIVRFLQWRVRQRR